MFIIDFINTLLYGILIQAPLHILNVLYSFFKELAGANLGSMFFNTGENNLEFNVNSPIFDWIWKLTILSVVACTVFYIVLLLCSINKNEPIKWKQKIKWPIFVFTSSVIIPIGFILIAGFCNSLFQIIAGTGGTWYLYELQVNHFVNDMDKSLGLLAKLSGINDMKFLDSLKTYRENLTYDDALKMMKIVCQKISETANSNGLPDVVSKCGEINSQITLLQQYFVGDNCTFNITVCQIQEIVKDKSNYTYNIINGLHVLNSNTNLYDKLYPLINQIDQIKVAWLTLFKDWNDISNTMYGIPCFDKMGTIEYGVTTDATPRPIFYKALDLITNFKDVNHFATLNNFLLGQNLVNPAGKSVQSLWNIIKFSDSYSQVWEYEGFEFKYTLPTDSLTGNNFRTLNLNDFCSYQNPEIKNSFELVVEIYRLVTGNTDRNWTGNYGKNIGTANIGIGFVSVAGSILVIGLFFLFMARRLVEIAVCTIWLIISAGFGIIDDGKNFLTVRRVTIAKMFTSIIMFLAFEISMTISNIAVHSLFNNTGTGFIGGLTSGLGKIFLILGCLLGGYSIANWIGVQYGDTNGLGESMRDFGLIKTMTGAGMAAGALALATGKKAVVGAGKSLNAITGGGAAKLAKATGNNLHNLTGNTFRSKAWKEKTRITNIQEAAEAKGIGKFISRVDENGKLKKSFELDQKIEGAGDVYASMLKRKGFSHSEQRKLDKTNTMEHEAIQDALNPNKNDKSSVDKKKLKEMQIKAEKIISKREGGKK